MWAALPPHPASGCHLSHTHTHTGWTEGYLQPHTFHRFLRRWSVAVKVGPACRLHIKPAHCFSFVASTPPGPPRRAHVLACEDAFRFHLGTGALSLAAGSPARCRCQTWLSLFHPTCNICPLLTRASRRAPGPQGASPAQKFHFHTV